MAGGKTLWWLPLVIGLATPVAVAAQTPASPGDVTFTKDIAPILQRSCQNCHRPDGVAPMSLDHLRRSAALGARDQAADRHRAAGRRDAAVVHREEHRHPALQGRPVAERRRDRDDRQVGRQRRAARQSRRHAAAAQVRRRRRLAHRQARSRRLDQGSAGQGRRARLVGRDREHSDRRSPRIATSRPSRSARSTTSRRPAPAAPPSAAATCSTT